MLIRELKSPFLNNRKHAYFTLNCVLHAGSSVHSETRQGA